MKNEIVENYNDEERVGTFAVAEGFDREHKNLRDLIEKYREDFEDFADLRMRKLRSTGGRPAVEFFLTFEQVLFLCAVMRNNDIKKHLVKGLIKSKDIITVIKSLNNFDFGDVKTKYVYAAVDTQGRIKIGISNNPEERLKNLNIGNADELRLVYTKEDDMPGYMSETILHNKCEQYRIRSEWFTEDAMEIINDNVTHQPTHK